MKSSILNLEIPQQRTSRPSLFVMPDPVPVRGRVETLDPDSGLRLPGVLLALAMGGGVVLASMALKWVYLTLLHIPFPPLR